MKVQRALISLTKIHQWVRFKDTHIVSCFQRDGSTAARNLGNPIARCHIEDPDQRGSDGRRQG